MAAFKKPHGRREHVFVAPEPAAEEAGAGAALSDVYTVLVLDALRGLPPRCRAVLVLRHFCGLAVDETADTLDLDDSRVLAFEAEGLGAFAALMRAAQPAVRGECRCSIDVLDRACAASRRPGDAVADINPPRRAGCAAAGRRNVIFAGAGRRSSWSCCSGTPSRPSCCPARNRARPRP